MRVNASLVQVMRAVVVLALVLGGLKLLSQAPPVDRTAFVPTRFTVVDQGTAGKPDLVLVPGLASSRAVWQDEAAKLAPNFRLHLLQLNGFAGQPAGANAGSTDLLPGTVEELHAYLAASHMHPDMVGHSLGGLLTLMLAAKYPGDVHKLVVVDALPFYGLLFSPNATLEAVKPYADAARTQMTAMSAAQWAALQPVSAAQLSNSPQGQKLVAAAAVASDRGVVTEAVMEDLQTDIRAELPAIKAPTLVVYEYDPTLQQPSAALYAETIEASYKGMPGVKMDRIEGARHFIMYDQPAKFDAALETFLKP